jgi:hypothetical protein
MFKRKVIKCEEKDRWQSAASYSLDSSLRNYLLMGLVPLSLGDCLLTIWLPSHVSFLKWVSILYIYIYIYMYKIQSKNKVLFKKWQFRTSDINCSAEIPGTEFSVSEGDWDQAHVIQEGKKHFCWMCFSCVMSYWINSVTLLGCWLTLRQTHIFPLHRNLHNRMLLMRWGYRN